MRGRKPISKAVKKLEGNPGQRRMKYVEPAPIEAPQVVAPPDWLPDEGKWFWEQNYDVVRNMGCLTAADVSRFAVLASTWAEWRAAEGPAKNAWTRTLNAVLSEFGMSAAARARLKVDVAPEKESEFDKFLRAGRKVQ